MKRFAIINNTVVENIAISENPLFENWIDISEMNQPPGVGWLYVNDLFIEPLPPIIPSMPDPAEWFIDVGPFYDRFGVAKMDILSSNDTNIRALLEDIRPRHWIDLKRADLPSSLAYIGSVIPSLTIELQTAILTTPVSSSENLVLRRLYFPKLN